MECLKFINRILSPLKCIDYAKMLPQSKVFSKKIKYLFEATIKSMNNLLTPAHGSRLTAHGSRLTAHGSRLMPHAFGWRLTFSVHGSRLTVHVSG